MAVFFVLDQKTTEMSISKKWKIYCVYLTNEDALVHAEKVSRLEMHGLWINSKNIKLTKNSKLQNDRYSVVMLFLVIKLKNKQNNIHQEELEMILL